jgi:hypothetical protein
MIVTFFLLTHYEQFFQKPNNQMSKLSKKFRQLKLIQSLIKTRSAIFHNIKGYDRWRNLFMSAKWLLKINLLPKYRKIKKYLNKKYSNVRIFRPEVAFSDFDLGLTAEDEEKTLFIQIITKQHFDNKEKGLYQQKIDAFWEKKKSYDTLKSECKENHRDLLKNIINVINFEIKNDYALFISEYRHFENSYKLFQKSDFEQNKELLIAQIHKYEQIFNKVDILWSDPTPNNTISIN